MEVRWDEERADRAVRFFEELLVHTKGTYARQRFTLAPFQRDEIIRPIFGTLMKDPDTGVWVRRYTLAWLEVGRGNGKSELMAGIALLLTGADDEEGAEVYGVARDIDQASLVFNVARRMVELSPTLSRHFKLYPRTKEIIYPRTASRYKVVPGDALGNLGQDPHGIVFDEVIAQKNGELWDAMKTGFKRLQPLMVAATTAGSDPNSFAKMEHDFSLKVAADPEVAPRRFVFIRSVPKEADLSDESAWVEGNPALGIFLRPQILRDEWMEAQGNVRAMRAFRQFRANQWLDTTSDTWVSLEDWMDSAGMVVESQLKGRNAYGGLVATSVDDLAAVNWTFPPKAGATGSKEGYQALWRFWLPEDRLPNLMDRTLGMAEVWHREGRLKLTEGDQIDIDTIVADIEHDFQTFNVVEMAHDSHGVIGIVQQLQARHFRQVVAIAPNNPGTALLDWERLIRAGEYHHGANPIVGWELGHTLVKVTAAGILRIDRQHSSEEVSGVYAAELALRRVLAKPERRSAYSQHDIVMG